MKSKIKYISKIKTGVFAKPGSVGDIIYLQSKYFSVKGELNHLVSPDILLDNISSKHLLNNGDILFAAKGSKNFASCYFKEQYNSVASTSFFVLRLKVENVLPEYVTWFLNQPHVIEYLRSKAKGTSTQSISKVELGELEIIIPALEKQKIILEIDRLKNNEKQLVEKLSSLRETLIQKKINNYLELLK